MAEWWTNTSLPPSTSINPKPFLSLNHLTFPVIETSIRIENSGRKILFAHLRSYYESISTKMQRLIITVRRSRCRRKLLEQAQQIIRYAMKRETRINGTLPHPDYILPWGHKTHPGRRRVPASGLCPKCPLIHVWLERDRRRSSTPPPLFPRMPQNRNPRQNLCISEASPWYSSFYLKQVA